MSRRVSRKKIDYSQFNDELEDYSGSDDDFQDSPNAPPAKRTRRQKVNKPKDSNTSSTKPKIIKKSVSEKDASIVKNDAGSIRKSRDDKAFERELKAALDLSKKNCDDVILIDDNEISAEDCTAEKYSKMQMGKHNPAVIAECQERNTAKLECDNMTNIDGASPRVDADKDGESDEEYELSNDVDDEEDEEIHDDDHDDADGVSEDDEEFQISKTKNKSNNPLQSKLKATPKVENIVGEKKNSKTKTAKVESQVTSVSLKVNTPSLVPSLSNTPRGGLRAGLKSTHALGGLNSPLISSNGNSSAKTPVALKPRSCPAVGGVSRNSGSSGIRLGLSRNSRVSKPLHSSVSLKTS